MNAQRLLERLALPPAWRQRGARLRRTALAWWEQHPRHERWLLAVCAGAALAALLWLAILRPAWNILGETRAQLPQLRNEMAQIQAVVREAQALRQGRTARVSADQVLAALNASLSRAGLEASVSVTEITRGRWNVLVNDAPATRLMDWLAGLPFLIQARTLSVVLERTTIDGRDRPGSVTGRIALARDEEPAR